MIRVRKRPDGCGERVCIAVVKLCLLTLTAFFVPLTSQALDSARVLTREGLISIVRAYHPVVRAAGLQVERAEAGIMAARGAFDPMVNASLDQKTLDGKSYYNYFNPEISIPTWYGLELVGGVEDVSGTRVNPEATIGELSYAGVKLNLSGVWLDTRRAVLRQAMRLRDQSLAERRLAVNNLLYEALSAYYNWQREYQNLSIYNEALANAEERLRFTRIEWQGGARPAIDTVEALSQLQTIQLQQSGVALAYANAWLELNNFLWLENGSPLNPAAPLMPQAGPSVRESLPGLEALLSNALNNHPKLAALSTKLDILSIDRQLKGTYLLPKLSVKGLALSKGYTMPVANSEALMPGTQNNSKLSVDLNLPLFLREARGMYRAAGLKIEEMRLEQDATALAIQNKVRASYNEVFILRNQISIAEATVQNLTRLYTGELLRFEVGESTLFILNSRQSKLLEGMLKLTELSAKLGKAEAGLYYAAGILQ